MIRRQILLSLLAACVLALPALARADSTCDTTYASGLARQGYTYLDAGRYQDARTAAGQLVLYAKNCNDPKVGYPSVVHGAYIGAAALHGLGDDARAARALQMGMMLLGILEKDSSYSSLVNAMEPKYSALSRELKPVASSR